MSSASIGARGEEMAVKYLQNNGFHVVVRNWMAGLGVHCTGEIDIIALKDDTLHFVEVKCRTNDTTTGDYAPSNAFTNRKAERIMSAVEQYIRQNEVSTDVSIDLITVNIPPHGLPSIRHYINIV